MFLAGYIECPQLPQEGACEILTAGTRSVVSTFEIKFIVFPEDHFLHGVG